MGVVEVKVSPLCTRRRGKNGESLLISLYVDDIVDTSSFATLTKELKCEMMNTLNMTYLGLIRYFLGLEVIQKFDGIFLRQRKYIGCAASVKYEAVQGSEDTHGSK